MHAYHGLHYEEDVSENEFMKNRWLYYQVAEFEEGQALKAKLKEIFWGRRYITPKKSTNDAQWHIV